MAVEENETKKISLRGLEFILIILLTLAGMAFWVLAGWGVSVLSNSFEPRVDEFQEEMRLRPCRFLIIRLVQTP
ncbi:MAG: hypothetical protein KJ077_19950 [Anaerolineae bacterium]|nr:hypothetical protein [Anaerolineae bacterium]